MCIVHTVKMWTTTYAPFIRGNGGRWEYLWFAPLFSRRYWKREWETTRSRGCQRKNSTCYFFQAIISSMTYVVRCTSYSTMHDAIVPSVYYDIHSFASLQYGYNVHETRWTHMVLEYSACIWTCYARIIRQSSYDMFVQYNQSYQYSTSCMPGMSIRILRARVLP